MIEQIESLLHFIMNCKEKSLVSFDDTEEDLIFVNTKDHTEYLRIFSSLYELAQEQDVNKFHGAGRN
jgi:hypothetical protein